MNLKNIIINELLEINNKITSHNINIKIILNVNILILLIINMKKNYVILIN